jgi:type II secretory pathway predicted ATPase ExeA
MYLEHFGLTELPFRLSPDPAFLYLSKHHARAKAYMESTIWFTDGFVVITGEVGSGKTTLIETFLTVRLLALPDEEGRTAGDPQPVPHRAVRRRAQGAADRR